MIIKSNGVIIARDFIDDDMREGDSWEWSRWILFVICILAFIIFVVSIIGLNRKRLQAGRAPIRGTAWITPPTYRQSQREYNGRNDGDYVPQYTATANENDLGYYDENGEFHLNSKVEYYSSPPSAPPPPSLDEETGRPSSENPNSYTSLERPTNAVTRNHRNSVDLGTEFNRNFNGDRNQMDTLYSMVTTNTSGSVEEVHISTPEQAKKTGK